MVKDVTALSVGEFVEKEKQFCSTIYRLSLLEKNMGCVDGKIIGTGQADYTKGSTAYTLFVDDNAFALIDIPGIEGDERKFKEIIKASLAKAHVIFYVNGSGKMIEQNSLDKIKEYMHDGTSVYAVFNVHIKGQKVRIPGIDKTLQEELAEAYEKNKVMLRTEEELRSFLGDNFKGSISLNGLLSFCSLAMDANGNTTIVPDRNKFLRSDQAKFLKEYNDDIAQMRADSHISQIQDVITEKIDHFDEYIREENLKKLKTRLSDMLSDIEKLQKEEHVKIKDILKDYDAFERNCENARDDFIQQIGLIGRDVVEAAFIPVREELFSEIENTGGKLKESDVEIIFDQHKNQITNDIKRGINKKINAAVREYQEMVGEAEKRLLKDMQRSQMKFQIAMKSVSMNFDGSFTEALKISGMDIGKGALKVLGYGASGFGIGSSIPVIGNVVGAVVGTVVGVFMVIFDFFTSKETRINRAKEQLNESLDAQITEITEKIKEEMKQMAIEEKIHKNHMAIQNSIQTQRKSLMAAEQILRTVESELRDRYQSI